MAIQIVPTLKMKKIGDGFFQCIYVDSQEVLLPVVESERETTFQFQGQTLTVHQKPIQPMTAHMILTSHHDIGYTDLSSEVIAKHVQALCDAVDAADRDDQYRISIEQFWSLEEFIKSAPSAYVEKMVEHLKSGRFELNASYGNMITEVMSHAELHAYTKPSLDFAKKHGFAVPSATHNDIPGFSYGLCRALCDSNVKMLVMGFPTYHAWGAVKLPPTWNLEQELGPVLPGGLVWESGDGKKLLMWVTEQYYATYPGRGGSFSDYPNHESIDDFFTVLYEKNYPYDVTRLPVLGGNQDNSPYTEGYCEFIRQWNAEYESPKLVMSVNAEFYRAFEKYIPDLKVVTGDVPGTDYPMGYLSMPDTASQQGRNRHDLQSAKALAFMCEKLTGEKPDPNLLSKASREVVRYDEHCTGFHFPAGPCATASAQERKLYAYLGASHIYELRQKMMGRIADGIGDRGPEPLLVVFNPTAKTVTGPVSASMRELDNSGQYLRRTPYGDMKPAQVAGRFHYNPQGVYLEGNFRLVDEDGCEIPFCLHTIEDIHEPVPYAGQRLGLGNGTTRYGFFEEPKGIKEDLSFVAENVPPFGYRTYRLVAASNKKQEQKTANTFIENEYYRIESDGGNVALFDKTDGCALLTQGQIFGQIFVRSGDYRQKTSPAWKHKKTVVSSVSSRMYFETKVLGLPSVTMCLSLMQGVKRIDASFKVTRDETPMLTTAISFPFAGENCAFEYDASLHIKKPAENLLTGAYQDVSCAVGWVKQYEKTENRSVICVSREASVYTFSAFRDFYVSTAHRCKMDVKKAVHEPPTPRDFTKGGIYSVISCTNFGTNFLVSDPCTFTVSYSFTTERGNAALSALEDFTDQVKQPLSAIFKHPERSGKLGHTDSVASLAGENMRLLDIEEDSFLIWNKGTQAGSASITVGGKMIDKIIAADSVEKL